MPIVWGFQVLDERGSEASLAPEQLMTTRAQLLLWHLANSRSTRFGRQRSWKLTVRVVDSSAGEFVMRG
jgi:hypothetical protein